MGFGDTFKKLVGIEDVEDDFTEEDIAAAKVQLAKEETRRPEQLPAEACCSR